MTRQEDPPIYSTPSVSQNNQDRSNAGVQKQNIIITTKAITFSLLKPEPGVGCAIIQPGEKQELLQD